jgi:hypothetical protein
MCQCSVLPTSKGKGISVHIMKAYGELEKKFPLIRKSLPQGIASMVLWPAILTLGAEYPAPIVNADGCVRNQGKKSLLLLLGIAPQLINNPDYDLITTDCAYIITVKGNQMKAWIVSWMWKQQARPKQCQLFTNWSPWKFESFRFCLFIPNNIHTAHNYTSTAFIWVIWHPEYI